jgi:hypothetical protein
MPGEDLTLPDGRKLTVARLTPSRMLDVTEAAGDASVNRGWMAVAMAVCHVTDIDGVPVPMPRDRDEIRLLADRLGGEGIAAVQRWVMPAQTAPGGVDQKTAALAGN